MATGVPDTGSIKLGPWLGHDDGAVAGAPYVRNSLNVVFDTPADGGPPRISRRPGRMGWLTFDADPGRRVANLLVYVSRTGSREMLAWLDPETPGDSDAKMYRLDGTAPSGVVLDFPNAHARQRQGGDIPGVQLYDHLLFLDSFGRLMVYDGLSLSALEALVGTNAAINDESYLVVPPTGRFLLEWRNRVVVMGGDETPRTIAISASNGSPEVPYYAPVGGANVWPAYSNFDVQTDEGDEITGGCVLHDRLVVATRSTVTVVDEDAVAPIARVKARHAGCVAPRSLVSIGDHVVFLGDRRIFAFNGETLENVSKPVERVLRDWVNWSAVEGAVAVNFGSKREYRIWLPVVGDGSNLNRLCLVWNYGAKSWRVAAGWYLFDREERRGAANHYEVTCATTHFLSGADQVLITGAADSTLFVEDVGELDYDGTTGSVFPAYVELPEIIRGEEFETFRDLRVDCLHDGSFIDALVAQDGRLIEQEIVRVLDGEIVADPTADDVPYVQGRALENGQPTFATIAAWPIEVVGPQTDALKLGLAQRARKVKLALILPGQREGVVDAVPGAIHQAEWMMRQRQGRR